MSQDTMKIVMDCGSYTCKVGVSGADLPFATIPTVVGNLPRGNKLLGHPSDTYVGTGCTRLKPILDATTPIERGLVSNWDAMEKVWEHIFVDQLFVDPAQHPVFLSKPPMEPQIDSERKLQVMFETFKVPAYSSLAQPQLALFSQGHFQGTVCMSGHGFTYVLPVEHAKRLPGSGDRLNLSGLDLTCYLKEILNRRGYSFNSTKDLHIIQKIKDKLGYAALDYKEELLNCAAAKQEDLSYELPDGQVIRIRDEMFRCLEPLFNPKLINSDCPGIHEIICESVMKGNITGGKNPFATILLSGGTMAHPGIAERIEKEVKALNSRCANIEVVTLNNPRDSVWIGGSICTSISSWDSLWISKSDYEEVGPNIVNRVGLFK